MMTITLETTSMVSPQACMYPITSIKLITTQIMVRMLPQMSANNRSMVTNTQAMERPIFRNNSVFITWKRPIYFPLKKATFFSRATCKTLTVFENHRKILIQHRERSELRLHFEWTKVDLKMPKSKNGQF